ncbi:hypothetical protein PF002_g16336 [Phytophthora fragariae]|uniref:Uncharacterized protein n=1 Tax=Phytophthora fragariae TaxID=53985 RepID=A0A6A4CG60_9STRA|nr:hypothetical protein PF003_g27401 [Phytophthora fragariae]KAE8931764.1 hypothetical protein PF009_g18186 [Phytophthora fragariae]KAE9087091.1 hypothetical protein PF007_g20515 [Phytophthora fragariae]KAE9189691.1 hypothetical protein PF004_g22134 [Phytophthora fragariae]KAE9218953.1 hypothetical protein PF002_g16336 [Phytophthora fragariae]
MQQAVLQAFATAYRTEHATREEMSCADSGGIAASSAMVAAPPSNDVSVSSAPTSRGMPPPGSAAGTTSPDRCVSCENSQPAESNIATAPIPAGTGNPVVAQAVSGTAAGIMLLEPSGKASRTSGEGQASEALTCSDDRVLQHAGAADNSQLVGFKDCLKSIPTRRATSGNSSPGEIAQSNLESNAQYYTFCKSFCPNVRFNTTSQKKGTIHRPTWVQKTPFRNDHLSFQNNQYRAFGTVPYLPTGMSFSKMASATKENV